MDSFRQSTACFADTIMSSVLGISSMTALIGGGGLVLISPPFVRQRGCDTVDIVRVSVWMSILFTIVACRDHYISIYKYMTREGFSLL